MRLRARDVSLISILAAIYVIISALPGIPIIGGKGKIDLAASIAPLFGIMLGPWKGLLAALIGVFLAWLLPPGSPSFHALLFLPAPVLSSLVAGLMSSRRMKVPGWMIASCILGVLVIGWYITWVGQKAPLYPIPHIIALILVLVLGKWSSQVLELGGGKEVSIIKRSIAIPLVSYCGLMTDHMYGNLTFIAFAELFMPLKYIPGLPTIFMMVLPISVTERLFMTAIVSLIGIPLLKALQALKIQL